MDKREGEFFLYLSYKTWRCINDTDIIGYDVSVLDFKKVKKTKQNQKKVSWLTYFSKVFILDLLPFEDYTFIWENQMIGLVWVNR